MTDPCTSSGCVATDQRSPDANPRHYATAIVKKASGRARSV